MVLISQFMAATIKCKKYLVGNFSFNANFLEILTLRFRLLSTFGGAQNIIHIFQEREKITLFDSCFKISIDFSIVPKIQMLYHRLCLKVP